MKKALAILMALALLVASMAGLAETVEPEASADSFAARLEAKYVDPDRIYSSDVRWWLGDASNTDEVLLDEIQALYDGGFRGVELCMQDDTEADDTVYAYGSEMWAHKWNLMMNKLLDLGMSVYLTSGTNWATSNVPASSIDPASEEALQVLAISNLEAPMLVNGGETFSGPVELPAAPKDNTRLNTVYAYRIEKATDGTERTAIVYGSAVKLWDRRDETHEDYVVNNGGDTDYSVTWTAPEGDGEYQIIATWSQGAYNSSAPGVEPCYTTNYFDVRGVEALRRFWEQHYLSDPALVEKIRQGDVQLFMDSLELTYGDGFTWWCEDAVEQFEAIKGYDPMPYIILVSNIGAGFEFALNTYYDMNGTNFFIFGQQNMATYMLAESDEYNYLTLREQLVNDWQDVMTQLYEERMLLPLKHWLNSIGIETRAQISYGKAVEITEPSAYVDYPEAENLNQYGQIDIYRLHTAGAKLQNKVLSTETGGNEDLYGQSFQRLLDEIYAQYAAGFQRVIWHIWTSNYGYGNWAWPGYVSGNMGGFYRWGEREPSYINYDEFNAHIGRIQQLMQTGRSRTDIAFIHNSWTQGMHSNGENGSYSQESKNWMFAHEGVHYRSTELQDHGYTYDYVSPDLLTIDHTTDPDYVTLPGEVTKVAYDPETGTLEGAGYKAIVIYQDWMDPDGAETVLELAKQGMPVVVLENAARYSTFASDVASSGRTLAEIMDELKSLENVRVAAIHDTPVNYRKNETGAYDDDVYEMLVELGVKPYAEVEENHQLLTQTRVDDEGNFYLFAYNYCPNDYHEHSSKVEVQTEDHGTNITTNIKLSGTFIPYSIDSYSGKVTELAEYSYEDGCTVFPISLDYKNIALFAFEKVDEMKPGTIRDTDAASAYMTEGGAVIRVTAAGTYHSAMNDGSEIDTEVAELPEASDITGWNLDVTSWTAGDEVLTSVEKIGELTTENKLTATKFVEIPGIQLDTLTTWDNIPEVGKEVSGTGVYTAEFEWDASKADGAYIDFGATLDQSMTVEINGVKVGGALSENPTKAPQGVSATIYDENGAEKSFEDSGRVEYTGGVNWDRPLVDIGAYLQDGTNTIRIVYNSSITNAALAAGVIQERAVDAGMAWYGSPAIYWGSDVAYRSNGPQQAKLIPYKDIPLAD